MSLRSIQSYRKTETPNYRARSATETPPSSQSHRLIQKTFHIQPLSLNLYPMRLSSKELSIIESTIRNRDPQASIYLFGSRVNDDAKGGDIDLLVISNLIEFRDEIAIRREILDEIGWQKLDLIVRPDKNSQTPIVRIAIESGILL
jgi:predicted nucleotidyltransferase